MGAQDPTEWLPPDGVTDLLAERIDSAPDGTLIILPAQVDSRGGLYPAAHLTAAKELRALGVQAEFLHSPDRRLGVSEFSAEEVVGFAIGVASNMTWDAAKAVFQYLVARASASTEQGKEPMVRLSVARLQRPGLEIDGLTLTAPATDSNAKAFLGLLLGENESSHHDGMGDDPATSED
jgi:hypothetical protein